MTEPLPYPWSLLETDEASSQPLTEQSLMGAVRSIALPDCPICKGTGLTLWQPYNDDGTKSADPPAIGACPLCEDLVPEEPCHCPDCEQDEGERESDLWPEAYADAPLTAYDRDGNERTAGEVEDR